MKMFANLNDCNIVTNVIVVSEEDAPDEVAGILFCEKLLGGRWIETFEDGRRGLYAGKGFAYSQARDRFISSLSRRGYVWDEEAFDWRPPFPPPTDEVMKWTWNEDSLEWDDVDLLG
tara:strand:+ start:141 stop:491 length:351 start_codon:yes stop_codon:yes gene_type:complete